MNAFWIDTAKFLGPSGRVQREKALRASPGVSFLETRGGAVRYRRAGASGGPRLLFATDLPNTLEHHDALVRALADQAEVMVFEPPGTGASAPAEGFNFSLSALSETCGEVLAVFGPCTLVFPCYLGFVAQRLAATEPQRVRRLVLPQVPSWAAMQGWLDGVDRRRVLRTPLVGQLLMSVRKRQVAESWYRASTGAPRFREAFSAAANRSFDWGGCYCLASLMQGLNKGPAPQFIPTRIPTAVVWGAKDRTHRKSNPDQSVPGAEVIRFEDCGHCPELEAPERFANWLLAWHQDTR